MPDTGETQIYDVVVVGAGPAGLAAALNLVRSSWRVLLIDDNRPRHAATLKTHGFITRDGCAPLELRRAGRLEFESYAGAEFLQARVVRITRDARVGRSVAPGVATIAEFGVNAASSMLAESGVPGAPIASVLPAAADKCFEVVAAGIRGGGDIIVCARRVVLATGVREVLPDIASLRAFYGTSLHSCFECDSYEKKGQNIVVLGGAERASLRAAAHAVRFARRVVLVPTGVLDPPDLVTIAGYAERFGFEYVAEPAVVVHGDSSGMTAVELASGERVYASAGFISAEYDAAVRFELPGLCLLGGGYGAQGGAFTSVPGVFAVGEAATGEPSQLLVAAGHATRCVPIITDSLLGY